MSLSTKPATVSKNATSIPRKRILAAAFEVFSLDGFDAGSLNDIAVKAGMSRPALLHHYPSKRALLVALLEDRDAELDDLLPWVQRAESMSLHDFLNELIALAPAIYDRRELVRLYHRMKTEASNPDHPAHGWVLARHESLRSATENLLDGAIRRGEIWSDVDTSGMAVALLGALEGIEAQWLIDREVNWVRALESLRRLVESLMIR